MSSTQCPRLGFDFFDFMFFVKIPILGNGLWIIFRGHLRCCVVRDFVADRTRSRKTPVWAGPSVLGNVQHRDTKPGPLSLPTPHRYLRRFSVSVLGFRLPVSTPSRLAGSSTSGLVKFSREGPKSSKRTIGGAGMYSAHSIHTNLFFEEWICIRAKELEKYNVGDNENYSTNQAGEMDGRLACISRGSSSQNALR